MTQTSAPFGCIKPALNCFFFFLWVVVFVPLSTVFLCFDCHQHEDMKCIWCLVCLEPFCGNFVKRVVVLSYVWLNNSWKMGSIYFPGSLIFNVWWAIILSQLNNNFKAVLYDTYSLGCVKKKSLELFTFSHCIFERYSYINCGYICCKYFTSRDRKSVV